MKYGTKALYVKFAIRFLHLCRPCRILKARGHNCLHVHLDGPYAASHSWKCDALLCTLLKIILESGYKYPPVRRTPRLKQIMIHRLKFLKLQKQKKTRSTVSVILHTPSGYRGI